MTDETKLRGQREAGGSMRNKEEKRTLKRRKEASIFGTLLAESNVDLTFLRNRQVEATQGPKQAAAR